MTTLLRRTIFASLLLAGADLWPVLAGTPGAKPPHEIFCFFRGLSLEAVRSGDWKLHPPVASTHRNAAARAKWRLFNLRTDIGETNNLASRGLRLFEVRRSHKPWVFIERAVGLRAARSTKPLRGFDECRHGQAPAQRGQRVLDDRPATCALQHTNLICEQRLSRVKDSSGRQS